MITNDIILQIIGEIIDNVIIYDCKKILNNDIIKSKYQTKDWRKKQKWYINGKQNECEKYQIYILEMIFNNKINKTYDRIYYTDKIIISNKNPYIMDNGFEFSENFDGKILINKNIIYINLKFICDSGGAQTRSLILVYNFIKYQLKYLYKNNYTNIYFLNILDGDCSNKNINKLKYLFNNVKYKEYEKYIFIGDTYNFYYYYYNNLFDNI